MIMRLLFLFLLVFIFPKSVVSFSPFIKIDPNPLPFSSSYSNWNETAKYQPFVLLENGVFKMWYASYNGSNFKIAYATSSDGINWTREKLLEVYPGFDNHDPMILKNENGYTLFFAATTNGGSQNYKLYRIDSTDGVNFDPNSRQLVLQPSGSLESNAVSSPYVIYEEGIYYLYYLCWGNQGFRICMATSSDGNSWQRCTNNPVISELSDGPTMLEKDGKKYLFFQSNLGLRQAESSDLFSCSTNWSNRQTISTEFITGPHILEKENNLLLYYSSPTPNGFDIFLAVYGNLVTPTPTLTPTITPTPTPEEKKKIIFIPGIMASWNKDALLHNKEVSFNEWQMPSFVKEYKGLLETLDNLGYKENKNVYIFNYDWRKNVADAADDLSQFILEKNLQNQKNNLVGHSLGGLIARIYGQKHGTQNVESIITVGSPHLGTAQAYRLVEAGEIERENSLMWLMEKLILHLNKKSFETDRQTISSIMPVSQDLFPFYDFLMNTDGNYVPYSSMVIKNAALSSYSREFESIFDILSTLGGNQSNNTLFGHYVKRRNNLDLFLGNYVDGRPINDIYDLGDKTILLKSSLAGNKKTDLPLDHREIIYRSSGIKTILNELGIAYQETQVIEGSETAISPSLIFTLLSPAEMEISFDSQIFPEKDGLIFMQNAQSGEYTLRIKGKSPGGKYKVLVGQIGDFDDRWYELEGEISSFLPFLQTDTYIISFNPHNLGDFPVNQNDLISLFDLLIKKYSNIKKEYDHSDLGEGIEEIQDAKKNFLKKKYKDVRRQILHSLEELFSVRKKAPTLYRNELYDALTQLVNLYQRTSELTNYTPKKKDQEKKLNDLKKKYGEYELYLLKQNLKKVNVIQKGVSLSLMKESLDRAEEEMNKNNLSLAEIILISATRLGREIK